MQNWPNCSSSLSSFSPRHGEKRHRKDYRCHSTILRTWGMRKHRGTGIWLTKCEDMWRPSPWTMFWTRGCDDDVRSCWKILTRETSGVPKFYPFFGLFHGEAFSILLSSHVWLLPAPQTPLLPASHLHDLTRTIHQSKNSLFPTSAWELPAFFKDHPIWTLPPIKLSLDQPKLGKMISPSSHPVWHLICLGVPFTEGIYVWMLSF